MNLVVNNHGWKTWNFSDRQWGPIVPPGTYAAQTVKMPTGRPAIVLTHPETVGSQSHDMIGEDKEHLETDIAAGKTLIDLLA